MLEVDLKRVYQELADAVNRRDLDALDQSKSMVFWREMRKRLMRVFT